MYRVDKTRTKGSGFACEQEKVDEKAVGEVVNGSGDKDATDSDAGASVKLKKET